MNLGDTIYAWQVLDEIDGEWGIISSMIPAFGISSPLVARSLDHATCDEYRFTVEQHRRMYGYPIRLARFTLASVVTDEDTTPDRHVPPSQRDVSTHPPDCNCMGCFYKEG